MGNCVQQGIGSGGPGGGRHNAGEGEGGRLLQMEGRPQGRAAPSVVKVKMLLTKGELGWLVARLKAGDRQGLEDVLHEMASCKVRGHAWRPSLESIVECPAETAAGSDDGRSSE